MCVFISCANANHIYIITKNIAENIYNLSMLISHGMSATILHLISNN